MNTLALGTARRRRAAPVLGAAERSLSDVVKPSTAELFALAVLLLFSAGTFRVGGGVLATTNLLVPTLLMVILGVAALHAARQDMAALWMPLTWARLALVSYYGAGSLVPYLGNDDTVLLLESFYTTFPEDAAKYNLVCVAFTLILLSAARATCGIGQRLQSGKKRQEWRPADSGFDAKSLGLTFLIPGLVVNFLYVKPHSFGLIGGTMPQVLAQVGLLTSVGYYILTGWALKERPAAIWGIAALVALEFFIGLLELAKTAALFPPIVFTIAIIQHRPTVRRIVTGAVTIFALYAAISPIVTYGRAVLSNSYGSILVASPAERWNIVTSYTPERAAELNDSKAQLAWARLSYVNAGTFAVNQFDQGLPGNSLQYAAVALVPRALYPSKPNITDVGRDFNIAVNGNPSSQSSPGLPSEMYWSAGWIGVLLGGLYVGLLLTTLSLYAVAVVRAEAWYLLPVVLLGMRLGIRMDGFLVPDFIGPLPVLIVAHILLTFLNSLTLKKK